MTSEGYRVRLAESVHESRRSALTTTVPDQNTEEIQDAGHVDVLIIGAGVSGIGAALVEECRFSTTVTRTSLKPSLYQ